MNRIALLAAACCLTSTAAWAHKDHDHDDKKTPPSAADMMKPPAEMEKLKGMIGTWSCTGKSADMGKPTMHAIKSTMKMTSELGGHWVMVDYVEEKTKENPMPFAFKETIGFDRASSKYQRTFIDNMGGTALMTTTGPSADGKIEWTGDATMGGEKTPMKDVITHKSDKETLVEVTMMGPDGKWMPVANMTCKK